jgi:hypothetical protein
MRSGNGWENFICRVIEFCVDHEIVIPNMKETYILHRGRARQQPDHFTTYHYFRVEVFRATLNTQLTKLNLRFHEKVMDLSSASLNLIPKYGFTSFRYANLLRNITSRFQPTRKDWIRVTIKPFCCGGIYK